MPCKKPQTNEAHESSCLFCVLPIEVVCYLLRHGFDQPFTARDMFRLAAVSPCLRAALQAADGLSVSLGRVDTDSSSSSSSQLVGELLHALATTFPRLSLVTFATSPPKIANRRSTPDWHTHWVSPPLYGRLVQVRLSGFWKDQGWGNIKGQLRFECKLDEAAVGAARAGAAPDCAPHQEEYFENNVGKDDWSHPAFGPKACFVGGALTMGEKGRGRGEGETQESFRFALSYHVGGGGGHELYARDLSLEVGLSFREWNAWMEWAISKLTHEGGWAWCSDGQHPSLALLFAPDGTARLSNWKGPKEESTGEEEVSLGQHGKGLSLEWKYYPSSWCVVVQPCSKEMSGLQASLVFDQDLNEFHVKAAKRTHGFSLQHHSCKSTYDQTLFLH